MRLRWPRPNDHVSTTRSEHCGVPRPIATSRRVAAVVALAFTLAWPAATGGRAAGDDGVECAGGLEAADLDGYFGQQRTGLWGADYQRATPLPDGRVLWLCQDAYLATGAGATLVHNAGLIQSGTCFALLAGSGSSDWLMGDVTTRYRRWFWPMGGEYNPYTDTVDVMVAELHETTSTYLTHVVPTATWRVSLRLPDLAVVDAVPSPIGPWATCFTFNAPTKCADCNTYFASWAPWTTANGDLIVGISHNRWDGRKSEVYRPTFFEVPAPPDTHEPTSVATSFEPARRPRHG